MKISGLLINRLVLIFSLLLFLCGISLPMFTLQKFIVLKDSFSLLEGSIHLLTEGEVFLFLVIFVFSILVPLYKYYLCFRYLFFRNISSLGKLEIAKRIATIGKWSMADVFVIAVIAATVKFGGLATVKIHIGLLSFGLSVIFAMILTHRILSDYELAPKVDLEATPKNSEQIP